MIHITFFPVWKDGKISAVIYRHRCGTDIYNKEVLQKFMVKKCYVGTENTKLQLWRHCGTGNGNIILQTEEDSCPME